MNFKLTPLPILLILSILFFWETASQAQHTPPVKRCIHYNSTPTFENWLHRRAQIRAAQNKRTTAEIVTIPVVVHVIHNGEAIGEGTNISKAQIESQIRILNEDFRKKLNTNGYNTHPAGADIEINFALAVQSPDGIPTDGIVRVNGGQARWTFLEEPTM